MRRIFAAILSCLLPAAGYAQTPIPSLATWESNMLTYGATYCALYDTKTDEESLGDTYYDAEKVFYLIGDYVGDAATWDACAAKAEASYRDTYVIPNNGGVAGWWNFTTGLREDWERKADSTSKTWAVSISNNGAFCNDGTPLAWLDSAGFSREAAYCAVSMINAEAMGEPHRDKLSLAGSNNDLVDKMLDHIDQWFITKDYVTAADYSVVACQNKYDVVPFMVGLTMNALIREYERSGDSRIPPAIKTALDGLWTEAWDATEKAFWYENCKTLPADPWPSPPVEDWAPDLNLLIAPAYAWYWNYSADSNYLTRGDAVFEGGVTQAWLGNAKQFNQNYTFAFEYVQIRSSGTTLPHLRALDVSVAATYASFILASSVLKYEVDCSVVVKEGVTTIETINSTEGLATRQIKTSVALTANTAYTATQSCTGLVSDTNQYAFTTRATPTGGNRTVPIQIAAAPTYTSIARATVQYDDNAALSSPDTVQNTSCAGVCTINLTIPAGRYYYRVIRQTSGDVTVATGAVQELQIP